MGSNSLLWGTNKNAESAFRHTHGDRHTLTGSPGGGREGVSGDRQTDRASQGRKGVGDADKRGRFNGSNLWEGK